jgi:hypothetical protein
VRRRQGWSKRGEDDKPQSDHDGVVDAVLLQPSRAAFSGVPIRGVHWRRGLSIPPARLRGLPRERSILPQMGDGASDAAQGNEGDLETAVFKVFEARLKVFPDSRPDELGQKKQDWQ